MDQDHPYTNQLIHESSPYLLQHAHNPVNWYPWGKEALQKAKQENKLIIISIGYAACHWCHVMEHESFEDSTVAEVMNEHFISIKVDREERPDIDQIYMNACQLMTGRGGWPLNTIALPDGRPIFAGTYFPKDQWLSMLSQVYNYYIQDPARSEEYAARVTEGIHSSELINLKEPQQPFSMNDLEETYENFESQLDFVKGGRPGAPKFPMPVNYLFLLRYYHLTGNKKALEAVEATLDNMAKGGIYDQVGGGFARYSTDSDWHIPHFEKMLYDDGQLVSLYSEAYQITKDPLYKRVVYETLEYIQREMTSPEGGFYSSLDADSEGEEGKYYVFSDAEIQAILGADTALFKTYFDIHQQGNWEEDKNVLRIVEPEDKIMRQFSLTKEQLDQNISALKTRILKERGKRVKPALDDKILTSWNALMLKGYSDAYRVFGEPEFLREALANAEFILSKAAQGNRLNRNYKNGKSTIDGFLDDYALAIDAFISLYQVTLNEKWLDQSKAWTEQVLKHFYDEKSGMFFYTADDHEGLIARKMELSDNVIPASNSVMAKNLFMLGLYYDEQDYISKAAQMLSNIKADVLEHPSFYANWAILKIWLVDEPYEVAIVGDDFEQLRKEWEERYRPNVLLSGGKDEGALPLLKNKLVEGQTIIYVCKNKVCQLPVTQVKLAWKQVE